MSLIQQYLVEILLGELFWPQFFTMTFTFFTMGSL